ncbi:MAG TPA: MarR family winged helix-turn-helix transcriptional regulator [Burkholderiaceae bacterium]
MASKRSISGQSPGTPQGCTNLKLRRLTRLVSARCEPFFSASGLKTTQYSLLSHIDHLGPLPLGQLARHMDLDASTLTRNLQPLLAAGLAEVLPADDARSRLVQITAAGRAMRGEIKADWKRAQLSINAALGDERVQRLHALLDECLELLREEAKAQSPERAAG